MARGAPGGVGAGPTGVVVVTAPAPYVECAAIVSGRVAWVLAPTLRARWPQALVDQLAPAMRDECLAVRDALLLAALAYQRTSAGGSPTAVSDDARADLAVVVITTEEAAVRLGVSGRRTRQLLEQGRLGASRRVGGRWLVDAAAVSVAAAERGAA